MARSEASSSRQGDPEFPDESLYREMIRENERILDRQHESLVRADETVIFGLKLAVLSLILGLTLAAYRLQASHEVDLYFDVVLGTVLMVGTLCHVVTFFLLGQALFSLVGYRTRFSDAPGEDWVLAKLKNPEHGLEDHLAAVIRGLAQAIQRNDDWLARSVVFRKNGLQVLSLGFLAYVISAIIIYLTSV